MAANEYEITDQGDYTQIILDKGTGANQFIYWSIPKLGTQIQVNTTSRGDILNIYSYGEVVLSIPRTSIAVPVVASNTELFNQLSFMVDVNLGGGGTVTSITTSGGVQGGVITTTGDISLTDTGVAAGTYQYAEVTVDTKGRITSIRSLGEPNRKDAVIDIVDNTLAPPTEVLGARYILDDTAGVVHPDWDGAAKNDIVEFDGSVWVAYTPSEGWTTFVDNQEKDALFVDDGTPQWELRPIGVAATTTRQIWVDATAGSDLTAVAYRRDLPFATIHNAVAAAVAGDEVIVLAGTYQYGAGGIADPIDSFRLIKAGVTVTCQNNGVYILHNDTTNTGSNLFSDDGVAGKYVFRGGARYQDNRNRLFLNTTATNTGSEYDLQFDQLDGDVRFTITLFKEYKIKLREDNSNAIRIFGQIAGNLDRVHFSYEVEKFTNNNTLNPALSPFNLSTIGVFTLTNSIVNWRFGRAEYRNINNGGALVVLRGIGQGCKVYMNGIAATYNNTDDINAKGFLFAQALCDFELYGDMRIERLTGMIGFAVGISVDGEINISGSVRAPSGSKYQIKNNAGNLTTNFDISCDLPLETDGMLDFCNNVVDCRATTLKGQINYAGNINAAPIFTTTGGQYCSKLDLRIETDTTNVLKNTSAGTQADVFVLELKSNKVVDATGINYISTQVAEHEPNMIIR